MKWILSICVCFALSVHGNPFSIEFSPKRELTTEDYIEVQAKLREVDTEPMLRVLYDEGFPGGGLTTFEDFQNRCTRGLRQVLIDPEKGFYPVKELVKIGKGGDQCIVCCVPFSGKYPYYINTLIEGLKEQKFNGYFYYRIGGWPNPTGNEIKYVGVPYSFKIFAMVEAKQLGFNKVLWIDSACYPLRNINVLFDEIESNGALLNWASKGSMPGGYIFPQTRALLKEVVGTDVLDTKFINTIIFGLKMDSPEAKELVRTYYKLAEMGTPFLSCFPEEWVLTSIIARKPFRNWIKKKPFKNLLVGTATNSPDSPEEYARARKKKAYFFHRNGR